MYLDRTPIKLPAIIHGVYFHSVATSVALKPNPQRFKFILNFAALAASVSAASCKFPCRNFQLSHVHIHAPVLPPLYQKIPTGAIKPLGWALNQAQIQADGLAGHLRDFDS